MSIKVTDRGRTPSFSPIAMTRVRWVAAGVALLIAAMLTYGLASTPPGPRTLRRFDPDRMADLELRMWQAYYAKEKYACSVCRFGVFEVREREDPLYVAGAGGPRIPDKPIDTRCPAAK